MAERALLLRRLARLNRTKHLFSMWHVFHQPLVYVMFAIASLHVGIAVYLGLHVVVARPGIRTAPGPGAGADAAPAMEPMSDAEADD